MSVALISIYDQWSAGNRSLHSVLNREGIEADLIFLHIIGDIFTPPSAKSFDSLMTLLKNLKPELVGISLRSQFWWIGKRIARRVRKELAVPVIMGGVHVTLNPEESIEEADFICRGEGEAALPELVRRLRSGVPVHDIPGIWTHLPNGEIVRNAPTIAMHDMDSLPLPVTDRSHWITALGEIIRRDPLFDDKNLLYYMISASRGCPFKCSFCCESVYKEIFGNESGNVRRRSVAHLFEEVKFVKNWFPKLAQFYFLDEIFNPPAEWMDEFARRYQGEAGLLFSVMIHPGLLSEKWIESLKRTGAPFSINFGLQSGSERVRSDVFDRPTSEKTISRVINTVNRYSFPKCVDIIVDNPFETAEESRQTALTLFRMKRPLFLQVYSMMFYPGLSITAKAIEAGFIKKESLPGYTDDIIEIWIPKLGDPGGDPLKTWLKALVHLHQLKMRNLFGAPKEYNPIPIRLLNLLAKKEKVSAREAKAAIIAHDLLLLLAIATYQWGVRIGISRELMSQGKFGEFFRRLWGVIKRAFQ